MKPKKQGGFPGSILFLCGFLLGVVLPNAAWRMQWQQKTMASYYLLSTFAGKKVAGPEYFFEVLRIRGSFFLLSVLCGFSIFGVPLAVISVLVMGAAFGALLTMSILQFGLAGGAVGLVLLLPHYLVYFPAGMYLMSMVYHQSLDIWRNYGIFPDKVRSYSIKALGLAVIFCGGIYLETYVNPWLVEKVVKYLNFF